MKNCIFSIALALFSLAWITSHSARQVVLGPTGEVSNQVMMADSAISTAMADSMEIAGNESDEIVFDRNAPADQLWATANQAYVSGDFKKAAALYTAIEGQDKTSAKLCYNIGNCFFKLDKMGGAVLWYNRALYLDPSDKDARYNLAIANAKTMDRIDAVPEFFLKTWIRSLGKVMSSNSWAALALVLLALSLGGIVAWLMSRVMWVRRVGFYGMIVGVMLCVIAVSYSLHGYYDATSGHRAVVMVQGVAVKSSPAKGGKDIFVIHEGTVVSRGENLEGWSQITLSNGSSGWVENSAIESI